MIELFKQPIIKKGFNHVIEPVRDRYPNAYSCKYLKGYAIFSDKTKKGSFDGEDFMIAEGKSNYFAWKAAKEKIEEFERLSNK